MVLPNPMRNQPASRSPQTRRRNTRNETTSPRVSPSPLSISSIQEKEEITLNPEHTPDGHAPARARTTSNLHKKQFSISTNFINNISPPNSPHILSVTANDAIPPPSPISPPSSPTLTPTSPNFPSSPNFTPTGPNFGGPSSHNGTYILLFF